MVYPLHTLPSEIFNTTAFPTFDIKKNRVKVFFIAFGNLRSCFCCSTFEHRSRNNRANVILFYVALMRDLYQP